MNFLQYIDMLNESIKYDTIDITPNTSGDALVKFGLWDYIRLNSNPTIPCTFSDRSPNERFQLSNEEASVIENIHDAFLQHNYDISEIWDNYDPIYMEDEIPYKTKDNKFKPSSIEPQYNIKFIEVVDQHHPEFATKLLTHGFEEPLPQNEASMELLKRNENYLNVDIDGTVKLSLSNEVVR